jgi:hypothetical protein
MKGFYSEENLRVLVNISKKYMNDKYEYVIDDEKELKKLVYEVMTDVDNECKGKNVPFEKKNIAVLNSVKEVYVRKYGLSQPVKKPNIQNLNRDKEIFGNRPVNIASLVPSVDPYQRRTEVAREARDVTRIMDKRDEELYGRKPSQPSIESLGPVTKEVAEDNETFMRKLKEFEEQRRDIENFADSRLDVDRETHRMLSTEQHDPKALFATQEPQQQLFQEPAHKELTINPRATQTRIINKYIGLASQDRSWWTGDDLYRYKYSVVLESRLRNIDAIQVGKVIIPDEIVQLNDPVKNSFNYDFTMAFPYLILRIEEFNDVYDGTNDTIKRAFCKLIYDKSYKGQNGRGYVIMKPEQKERKFFYPAPLGSIGRISISILRPSGALLNNSVDSYKAISITYDNAKPNYIKITTRYFDTNEFFVGDTIIIRGYNMTKLSLLQNDTDIQNFNLFINNGEGHEIIEQDAANPSGFINSFYVMAPGTFDSGNGQYVVSSSQTSCLNNYNTALVTPLSNTCIMNLSMQNSISMNVECIVDDARTIDVQSRFNF